jgi:DNA polymerase-4
MDRYAEASRRFIAILGDFSPEVEALSLRRGVPRRHRRANACSATARRSRRADQAAGSASRAVALVASVGVAPIKLAAKIASDIDKPDGLRVVAPDELLAFLHPAAGRPGCGASAR